MVYQEGFRDPGQKSGFGSSQSLCPAPQWVVMAASYSRKVSVGQPSSCPFPTPSGGCCPGRPCRSLRPPHYSLSQPRQRPSLPFQGDVCSISCYASQNTIAGHILALTQFFIWGHGVPSSLGLGPRARLDGKGRAQA